jgi:hypothetical protein
MRRLNLDVMRLSYGLSVLKLRHGWRKITPMRSHLTSTIPDVNVFDYIFEISKWKALQDLQKEETATKGRKSRNSLSSFNILELK